MKRSLSLFLSLGMAIMFGAAGQAGAFEVTLSPYTQGFNINAFYNNGDFDVEAGIVNADPSSLLVIVGDPANVEETLKISDILDPFGLFSLGADFHFGEFQPFRFMDRFNGLFSTTVDDPVLFLPDNGTVSGFHDDRILADDRIDLLAYADLLPPSYYEVDFGDTIVLKTLEGIALYVTRIVRNADYTVTFDILPAPEPGTVVLLGLGLVGIIGIMRRRRNKIFTNRMNLFLGLMGFLLVASMLLTPDIAHAYLPGEGAPIMEGLFDFPKAAIVTAFSRNAVNLGLPTNIASSIQGIDYQTFEKGIIFFKSGFTAYAIYDPFYTKWKSLGGLHSVLSFPNEEAVGAWGSPQGTGGRLQRFSGGHLYVHDAGSFEVRGAILGVFEGNGGTSKVGFPISGEEPSGPFQNAVSYFEGDKCITSEDGIEYKIFENCVKGRPLAPPKLKTVNGPGCVAVDSDCGFKYEPSQGEFTYQFDPYKPKSYEVSFDPSMFAMPLFPEPYNLPTLVMSKEQTFQVQASDPDSGKNYGDAVPYELSIVNGDVSIGVNTNLLDPLNLKELKYGLDLYRRFRDGIYPGSIDELIKFLNTPESPLRIG